MEKKSTFRSILLGVFAVLFVACAFGGGVATGYFLPSRSIPPETTITPVFVPETDPAEAGTPSDLAATFQPFWEAWDIVHQQYVDQPVDDTALMEGAMRGMLESLGDPHTIYMDPKRTEDENTLMSGEYEGIGAWVDTTEEYLTIISPISGSPAEKAGLLPGDKIVGVDGMDVTGMDPEAVRQKVLGPGGTTVVLTIRRDGVEQPFDVTITRARIVVPSVESKMLDNDIAYVKITLFGEKTARDLHGQLEVLMAQKPKGLILDLRNNGGGLLSAAVSVGSEFLDSGVVLYEKYGDGTMDDYPVLSGGLATKVPVVVLVNQGTASASEIVAGAIQDYGRGKLVGVTTYGKGSVQYWVPISNGGTVRVTIARWLTPNGRTIDNKVGLTPDVIVERTAEDAAAGRDPQLDAAIELLLNP